MHSVISRTKKKRGKTNRPVFTMEMGQIKRPHGKGKERKRKSDVLLWDGEERKGRSSLPGRRSGTKGGRKKKRGSTSKKGKG